MSGLKGSHYVAMAKTGMTDAEIAADWASFEADYSKVIDAENAEDARIRDMVEILDGEEFLADADRFNAASVQGDRW